MRTETEKQEFAELLAEAKASGRFVSPGELNSKFRLISQWDLLEANRHMVPERTSDMQLLETLRRAGA